MVKLKKLIILLLPFAICFNSQAQGGLHFNQITSENGLPTNSVNCIHQDSKGFIWFGTYNGLVRYDGYELKTYVVEKDNPHSISGNRITAIHEDENGMLWIGTWHAGLNLYNPSTEVFIQFEDDKLKQSKNNIHDIVQDSKGNIWLGVSGSELIKVNRTDSSFSYFNVSAKIGSDNTGGNITSLVIDQQDVIWMSNVDCGYITYDIKMNFFRKIDTVNNVSIFTRLAKKLYLDSKGFLWLLTNKQGIYRVDTKTNTIEHIIRDPKTNKSFENFIFTDMVEDQFGNYWFTTDGHGLIIHNLQKDSYSFIEKENDVIGKQLNSNALYCIVKGNTDIMWIGTFSGGVNYYDPNLKKFNQPNKEQKLQEALIGESVLALLEDSKGNIWVGTDGGGLFKMNMQTNDISNYRSKDNHRGSLSTNVG